MSAKISGPGAAGYFANEPGKHVCQRIPVTETKGRKQTSTVSVAIMPLKNDTGVSLQSNDLKIEPVNFGGPGGQNGNRTLSGCRMTHLPTKLSVSINGRDYHANEKIAYKILTAKVNDLRKQESDAEYRAMKQEQMGGGSRSGKRRTYNFLGSRVVDHVLGTKTGNIKAVMKGRFDLLF